MARSEPKEFELDTEMLVALFYILMEDPHMTFKQALEILIDRVLTEYGDGYVEQTS